MMSELVEPSSLFFKSNYLKAGLDLEFPIKIEERDQLGLTLEHNQLGSFKEQKREQPRKSVLSGLEAVTRFSSINPPVRVIN